MIQAFTMADVRRAVARRPMGWPVFTVGDLYPDRVHGRSARGRRLKFRDWMRQRGYGYTASDTQAYVGGTVWTWSDSAGTPTFNLTLNALASAAARQGAKCTTTIVTPPNGGTNAVPPAYFSVQLTVTLAVTGTTGGEVQVYLGWSPSGTAGTSNPGGMTGTDAAYTNTNTFSQLANAGSLIVSADLTTSAQQQVPFAIANNDPTNSPYFSPVIYNLSSGQAFKATNNVSTLTIVSSDTAARSLTLGRSASDNPASVDMGARILGAVRSAVDTFSSGDAATRAGMFARTVTIDVPSSSDLAVGVIGGGLVFATVPVWVEDARPVTWQELRRQSTWTEAQRPLTIANGDSMNAKRRPGEVRTYTIDMSAEDEILAGATINSVGAAVAVPYQNAANNANPITFGVPAVVNTGGLSGKAVTVPVTGGGTDGLTYLIRVLCTLSDGSQLYGEIAEDCTWKPFGTV